MVWGRPGGAPMWVVETIGTETLASKFLHPGTGGPLSKSSVGDNGQHTHEETEESPTELEAVNENVTSSAVWCGGIIVRAAPVGGRDSYSDLRRIQPREDAGDL